MPVRARELWAVLVPHPPAGAAQRAAAGADPDVDLVFAFVVDLDFVFVLPARRHT